jgi:hypothetical protein
MVLQILHILLMRRMLQLMVARAGGSMLNLGMIVICVVGVVFFAIVLKALFKEMNRHRHK